MAFITYTFASLTDFLDGFIARSFNQKSAFGQILDPVADKFLTFATYFSLYLLNFEYKPGKLLLVSILIKEILIAIGSLYLLKVGNLPKPTLLGKLSVALLMAYGGFLLLLNTGLLKVENLYWFEYGVVASIWLAILSYLGFNSTKWR